MKQLDELIQEFAGFDSRSLEDLTRALPEMKAVEIVTRSCAAIERVAGRNTLYWRQADDFRTKEDWEQIKARNLIGVLGSLRADLKAGYLVTLEELVHAELFSDFLDMAKHLLDLGYKDAAAVITGSSLEAHLRQLAKRWNVPIDRPTSSGGVEPKKADTINADLVKAGAYAALDQKSVTAWLDLRNKAAHGRYSDYEKAQVGLMIDSVRNFMIRCPA